MVDWQQKIQILILAIFLVYVFVLILGQLMPDFVVELSNVEKHPNGGIVLALIALFPVLLVVGVALSIFDKGAGGGQVQEIGFRNE